MKKIIKMVVIVSMKIALWRMKFRLFLYIIRSNTRSLFRKTIQKLKILNCSQKKNAVKLVDMEVEEI